MLFHKIDKQVKTACQRSKLGDKHKNFFIVISVFDLQKLGKMNVNTEGTGEVFYKKVSNVTRGLKLHSRISKIMTGNTFKKMYLVDKRKTAHCFRGIFAVCNVL